MKNDDVVKHELLHELGLEEMAKKEKKKEKVDKSKQKEKRRVDGRAPEEKLKEKKKKKRAESEQTKKPGSDKRTFSSLSPSCERQSRRSNRDFQPRERHSRRTLSAAAHAFLRSCLLREARSAFKLAVTDLACRRFLGSIVKKAPPPPIERRK